MTTTTTTNEAAERLLTETWAPNTGEVHGLVKQALAAERRATVERIRERLARNTHTQRTGDILAILDEEAAR